MPGEIEKIRKTITEKWNTKPPNSSSWILVFSQTQSSGQLTHYISTTPFSDVEKAVQTAFEIIENTGVEPDEEDFFTIESAGKKKYVYIGEEYGS